MGHNLSDILKATKNLFADEVPHIFDVRMAGPAQPGQELCLWATSGHSRAFLGPATRV